MKIMQHEDGPMQKAKARKRFEVKSIHELKLNTNNASLVKGIIPEQGIGVVYGKPGCGKSFFVLDLALKIASGREVAGRKVTQTGVIYVCAEGGQGFIRRVIGAQDRLGLKPDIPFGLITEAPDLGDDRADLNPLIVAIRDASFERNWRPGLIVLDTLARTIGSLDESKPADQSKYVQNVTRIEREFNAVVLIVHHSGVSNHDRMRGSNNLEGASEFVIAIESTDDGTKTARADRVKDGEDKLQSTFRLEKITLGHDDDGDPITTCVVTDLTDFETAEPPKAKSDRPPPPSLRLFLDVFDETIGTSGQSIRPWLDGPEVKGIKRDTLRDALFDRLPDDTPNNKRQKLFSGLRNANDRKLIASKVIAGETWLWRL